LLERLKAKEKVVNVIKVVKLDQSEVCPRSRIPITLIEG